jgi:hypothetical protein
MPRLLRAARFAFEGTIASFDRLRRKARKRDAEMSRHKEACVAHAAICIDVAEKTCSAEDRREFLSFADAWDRLADEIEQSERLVSFIDGLNMSADTVLDAGEFKPRSNTEPLRQLAAAIVSLSDRVASEATAHRLSVILKRRSDQA